MRRVRVDSSKWLYGAESQGYLCEGFGESYCVLGFVAKQVFNLTDRQIRNRASILAAAWDHKNMESYGEVKSKLPVDMTDWEYRMFRANDTRLIESLTERKAKLREIAAEAGIKLVFSRN